MNVAAEEEKVPRSDDCRCCCKVGAGRAFGRNAESFMEGDYSSSLYDDGVYVQACLIKVFV